MSRYYTIAYALKLTPWEITHPDQRAQLHRLFDHVEQQRHRPFGAAIDLGCGNGTWSIALAHRGWYVTGVDNNRTALRRARTRAEHAEVSVDFQLADVEQLSQSGITPGYRLVLDLECFNHLDPPSRAAMGREVTAVTAPDATMIMLTWSPGRRGPFPPGASRTDIQTAYPDWRITTEEPFAASALPAPLKRLAPSYRLLTRR